MEKEDTISVQWAQEDVETSYNVLNNNNIGYTLVASYSMCAGGHLTEGKTART
jgi:hypothetical protein